MPKDPSPLSCPPIPVVDVAGFVDGRAAAGREVVETIRFAMERVGFFMLVGHGLDWSTVDEAFAQTRRFFDMSTEQKMAVAVGSGRPDAEPLLAKQRGYIAFGGTTAVRAEGSSLRATSTNEVESFFLNDERRGQNQWPQELGGFREAILAYHDAVHGLSNALLPLYARALELPDNYFDDFFEGRSSLRLSHYPAASAEALAESWAFRPHTDGNFLTLLPANEVSGLQIRPEGQDWLDAPYVPRSFVVNSGDTLKRWSNNRVLSTPHRVLRPQRDRYAMPYFHTPRKDRVLEILPSCVSENNPALYAPLSLDKLRAEFKRPDFWAQDKRLQD